MAALKLQESEAKKTQAKANYYPQVSNESSLYNILEKQRLMLPAGSLGEIPVLGAVPAVPTTIYQGGRSLLLMQTTIAQPLTQLFKIRQGDAVARADVDIAKTQTDRARIEVAAKVKELYYTLLGLRTRQRAAQAAYEEANAAASSAEADLAAAEYQISAAAADLDRLSGCR